MSSKIQRSQVSAFHVSYRISLRSSSIHDPSDPPFKVILLFIVVSYMSQYSKQTEWVVGPEMGPDFFRPRAKRREKAELRTVRPSPHRWTEVTSDISHEGEPP